MFMSSYKFEIAAKNAVLKTIKERYNEEYSINDISMVWFSHVLGSKKIILIDNGRNQRIYEVTYNNSRSQMYVDIYEKASNTVINSEDINTTPLMYSKELLVRKLGQIAESGSLSQKYVECINQAIISITDAELHKNEGSEPEQLQMSLENSTTDDR